MKGLGLVLCVCAATACNRSPAPQSAAAPVDSGAQEPPETSGDVRAVDAERSTAVYRSAYERARKVLNADNAPARLRQIEREIDRDEE